MRLIRELNPETRKLLERINRQSKFPQVRDRAKCVILSYQGFAIKKLMGIFGVSRKTIYNWFTRWEEQQILGIYNQKGRGRKSKFNQEEKEQIKEWVKAEPKALKQVVIKIHDQWGIEVSKETIKRLIKKLNMRWKRMKRGMSKTPDEWEIEVKQPRLVKLKSQDEKGEIDLRYLDESGFSLLPYIPYGWQEIKQRITLRSCQSPRINVLGLMNRQNELFYETYVRNIDSEVVIKFLDKFSEQLSKPTVVVMDQASIHTSDKIIEKLTEWQQKNLEIFWLPTYSPKQNLIEILWKFIKYEWIEVGAYENWNSLLKYLKKVLDNLGQKYVINFV